MTAPQPHSDMTDAYHGALRGLRSGLAVAAAFSAAISLLMLTGSIYMLQVYDRVLASGSVPTLLGLFAIVVVLYAFLALYDLLRTRLLGRLGVRLDLALGERMFQDWIEGGRRGADPQAQPLRDLETLRGFLSGPAVTALFDLPWVPVYLVVLFVLHPFFGWLTLGGAGVALALAVATHLATRGPIHRSIGAEAAARDFAERSRRTAETILAMGMSSAVTARWRRLGDSALAAGQAAGEPAETLAALSRAFRMLLQSGMLTLGAWLVIGGEITGGMIIASSILSGKALGPVDQTIGQWRSLGRALEAHRRLADFSVRAATPTPVLALPEPRGALTVKGLVKLLPGRQGAEPARILDAVSFELSPGEGLGVIGASASGKSTLARLLTGALAPDGGEVRLDGATLEQWDPARLGRCLGYLPQSVELLPGTIRDNIARFDPGTSDAAVLEAADLAGVHEMILRLPEGYGTAINPASGRMPLSGGQVQRIGLARALCGRPRLLVLDEPNSNLDVAGDMALTRAITVLREGGTTVVVMAHRPSALAAVDKVMILSAGRITQFGDKEDVLGLAPPLRPAAQAPEPGSELGRKPHRLPSADLVAERRQRALASHAGRMARGGPAS